MKSNQSFSALRVALLGILAASLSAGVLSAADYSGKFTLPFQAQWGSVVLPPGDYTFSMNTTVAPHTAKVYGQDFAALIMAEAVSDRQVNGHSALIVTRSGGKLRIRALHLSEVGLVFSYSSEKSGLATLAQAPEIIQRLPVFVSGK